MGFAAGQGRVEAQEPGHRLTLPGFSIEPLYGNGWSIARPEGFPGLLGYLIMKKIPGWFPIAAEEVPVPLLEWQGASREDSGVEQVVFTKKLSNGQLGATIVRASWTQLAPGNDLLARTMQVREQELRKSFHVLKIETRATIRCCRPVCGWMPYLKGTPKATSTRLFPAGGMCVRIPMRRSIWSM